MICDICGKDKEDVECVPDQYILECDGTEVMSLLCDDCYCDRADEV
jgi:hypothetical protein